MISDELKYCYKNETSEGWINHRKYSHLSANRLGIQIVKNALCLPDRNLFNKDFMGGVYDQDYRPVPEAFQRDGIQRAEELLESSNISSAQELAGTYVYLGQYRRHYGSFLIDSVSRLWFARSNPEQYRYIYMATQTDLGIGLHSSAISFLKYFGIDESKIILITEPTCVEELIIPEMSYNPLKDWHIEYLDTIYQVVDNIPKQNLEVADKVYFSRSKFASTMKSDFGEETIVRFFEANGFKIIYPEEHDLAEQIFYVNNCKIFATIGGSCAHNIIFSKTKPKMILFNRMNGYQFHQWFLNEMAGVEPVTYVDAYNEPYRMLMKTSVSGPFLYCVNRNVRHFAKDYGLILPKIKRAILFRSIVRYSYYSFRTIAKKIVVDSLK